MSSFFQMGGIVVSICFVCSVYIFYAACLDYDAIHTVCVFWTHTTLFLIAHFELLGVIFDITLYNITEWTSVRSLLCLTFENCALQTNKLFDEIVEVLLAMLQRDVPDNCRQSQQYFQVLHVYVQMVCLLRIYSRINFSCV